MENFQILKIGISWQGRECNTFGARIRGSSKILKRDIASIGQISKFLHYGDIEVYNCVFDLTYRDVSIITFEIDIDHVVTG